MGLWYKILKNMDMCNHKTSHSVWIQIHAAVLLFKARQALFLQYHNISCIY